MTWLNPNVQTLKASTENSNKNLIAAAALNKETNEYLVQSEEKYKRVMQDMTRVHSDADPKKNRITLVKVS